MKIGKLGTLVIFALLVGLLLPIHVSALRYINMHDTGGDNLWYKEGSWKSAWNKTYPIYNNGMQYVMGTASRIGFVDNDNNLWVLEGQPYYTYQKVATNVLSAAMAGNNIYIIDSDYHLDVKQGSIDGVWTKLADNAVGLRASSNRIAIFANYDGAHAQLLVKEGGIYAQWKLIATPLVNNGGTTDANFGVSDSLVAYSEAGSSGVAVKEGSLSNGWRTDVWTYPAYDFRVGGNRLCIMTTSSPGSQIYCKEGTMSSPWVLAYNNAYIDDALQDKLSVTEFGSFDTRVLDGTLTANSGWQTVDNNGYDLQFSR